MAEARLHEGARHSFERLAGRAQDLMDGGRRFGLSWTASADGLQLQRPVFPSRLLPLRVGAGSLAGSLALELRFGHAHYLFGDLIGFLFEFVSRRVDRQFCLDHRCRRRMYGNPAKVIPKERRFRSGQLSSGV